MSHFSLIIKCLPVIYHRSLVGVISVFGSCFEVEIFAQQSSSVRSRTSPFVTRSAQIRHILLRAPHFNPYERHQPLHPLAEYPRQILARINECCSQLIDLKSIVLEEAYHRADDLLKTTLPHARCQLVQLTTDDRHQAATAHNTHGLPPPSPFWTLDKFAALRQGL